MKYLGLTLDSRWRFDKHFDRLASRVEGVAAALGRLLPNLGGPEDGVRRRYAEVVQAVALYEAPVWVSDLVASRRGAMILRRVQRRMIIRVARGYRTISHEAANILAGTPPMDFLAGMHITVYDRRKALRRDGVSLSGRTVEVQRRQARQSIV
ncbi:reverse transcriptase [Lasius niger]|uniref:Reverse transcriptase n=1 Tax=Lasius niger TaxID=67767 RepID=A0A0J7KFV7_LASNI|nr:reverse transcriptase [Lasius niger]